MNSDYTTDEGRDHYARKHWVGRAFGWCGKTGSRRTPNGYAWYDRVEEKEEDGELGKAKTNPS